MNEQQENTTPAPAPKPSLTKEEAERMASVYARLTELKSAPADATLLMPESRTPGTQALTREAEIAALVEYLAPLMLEHADELLGGWFVLKNEYSPLVRALAPITQRLLAMQPKYPAIQ